MRANDADSFWARVAKTETCWLWTGVILQSGYGQVRFGGATQRAHRLAYRLSVGEIPDGLYVCHRCDNPACVRPEHLFLGTAADNAADMVAKARQATGERTRPETRARGERHGSRTKPERVVRGSAHYAARLTEADVEAIRREYAEQRTRQVDLAKRYGVGQAQISAIVRGAKWKGVGK